MFRTVRLTVCACLAAALAGCGATSSESHGATAEVRLAVQPLNGMAPDRHLIHDVLTTLRHRLSAAGIHGTAKTTTSQIALSVPASDAGRVKALATQVGILRFRQVLEVGKYSPASPSKSLDLYPSGQSSTLTAGYHAAFDSWDCANNPATGDTDKPDDFVIACDAAGADASYRYLLAPAALEGNEVRSASAGLSPLGKSWQVNLQFTGRGAGDWLRLTRKSYEATDSGDSGFAKCVPPKGCNAVGIVLDGVVESAPAVQLDGIPGGLAQITGDFNQAEATDLADVLKYGALPARLTVVT